MDGRQHYTELPPSLRDWCSELKCKFKDFTSEVCPQYFEVAMNYLSQHPIIAISLVAIAVTCIIPILVFLLFAGLSIFVTFFLFFAAEGTLIIIGLGVLVGVILILCSVLIIGLVTAAVAWYLFSQFGEYIFSSFEDAPPVSPQTKRK